MNKSDKPTLRPQAADRIRGNLLGEVGYGKPPEHTRFKKGCSGNPSGRPPNKTRRAQLTSTAATVLAEAQRLITVVENGDERQITLTQAMIKAQFKAAVRGNSFAQERALSRIEKAERVQADEIAAENEQAKGYIDKCRDEIETAAAEGRPIPRHYPDPDDFVFEPGERYHLVGPSTEADAAPFEHAARVRDVLFLQSMIALQPRSGEVGVEMMICMLIDERLPPSLRRGEDGWLELAFRVQRASRTTLIKDIQRAWRALGVAAPRATTFPAVEMKELLRSLRIDRTERHR